MRWNPYMNAAMAAAYIGAVALLINYISSFRHDTPDTIVDSVSFLSLFVFSAAVMAFLFFYRPAILLLENKRSQAISYFSRMLLTFGGITVVALLSLSIM
ncbi:MAG: hypothetical protein JO019_02890 [Candidatus Kaiserbacteria bacterium]|nr:hypothetical protein [Candidatus Kaiserbacteria bacterium]